MLKDNIIEVFKNFNSHIDEYLGALYIKIFKELPHAYRIFYDENDQLKYKDAYENFYEDKKQIKTKIDSRKLLQNLIRESELENKKYPNIESLDFTNNDNHILFGSKIICYSPHEYIILGDNNSEIPNYNFLMNITLSEVGEMANTYEEIFCDPNDIENIFNGLKEYFEVSQKEEKVEFGIAALDQTGNIYTTWYDYNKVDVDINKNYNDDFEEPYDKLCSIIEEEDTAALVLLYGMPGTGKSTLIKHFISEYPEKDFIFIDGNLLYNASPDRLLSYFIESQNTIFILEDCEKALTSRELGYNPVMTTILNITDGIISDVLGIKLICTFNTNLKNVDEALLRKGRLSLKYEFKKLSKDKVQKILNDYNINNEMTLADIYNYKEENDFSKKKTSKIGF